MIPVRKRKALSLQVTCMCCCNHGTVHCSKMNAKVLCMGCPEIINKHKSEMEMAVIVRTSLCCRLTDMAEVTAASSFRLWNDWPRSVFSSFWTALMVYILGWWQGNWWIVVRFSAGARDSYLQNAQTCLGLFLGWLRWSPNITWCQQ